MVATCICHGLVFVPLLVKCVVAACEVRLWCDVVWGVLSAVSRVLFAFYIRAVHFCWWLLPANTLHCLSFVGQKPPHHTSLMPALLGLQEWHAQQWGL